MQRRADDGHGINTSFDNSRPSPGGVQRSIGGRDTNEAEGGASFYFGFETWQQDPENAYFTYGANSQYGLLSQAAHRDLSSNTAIAGTYNVPGGALGSLATNAFSLGGYAAADKPTLYFNYFLETQGANSVTDQMRDSFRVLVSANGGATWDLLATNNSILSTAATTAELPRFISTSSNASTHPRQRVQEVFDNTDGWRQARVDLSDFAGASNLQIRFDFSTAGTMNQGITRRRVRQLLARSSALSRTISRVSISMMLSSDLPSAAKWSPDLPLPTISSWCRRIRMPRRRAKC